MEPALKKELEELKEKIQPLQNQLAEAAQLREKLENDIYSLVAKQIDKAYEEGDLKTVQHYINILPKDSSMRLLSVYKYHRAVKVVQQKIDQAEAESENNSEQPE